MRTLAVDFGSRRVGLALSDEGGRFATPLDVLNIASAEDALRLILDLIRHESVERILLGLPLNMDDSIGPAARQTLAWGRQLAQTAGVQVLFVDERLSSFEAEQQLADRKRAGEKLTRRRKRQRQDALVAANLLQAFLDGRLPPFSPPE